MIRYLMVGIGFGIVLVKGQIISWFRIQEMFHFESFHMYGVLMSAAFTAFIGLHVIRRWQLRTLAGEAIVVEKKEWGSGRRYWIGGAIFGVGWAMTGACPGPLYALIGAGSTVFIVTALAALAGTWTYAVLRPRLPH